MTSSPGIEAKVVRTLNRHSYCAIEEGFFIIGVTKAYFLSEFCPESVLQLLDHSLICLYICITRNTFIFNRNRKRRLLKDTMWQKTWWSRIVLNKFAWASWSQLSKVYWLNNLSILQLLTARADEMPYRELPLPGTSNSPITHNNRKWSEFKGPTCVNKT